MSSHHIIREKQEPALIIADGEACSTELLGQLLEWSPTVMVLDGALKRVLPLGIKVDVWLGDFDSSKDFDEAVIDYPFEKVHTPDQLYTDLEKGIMYLIEKGYPAVNIVWGTGMRMDHTLNNLHSLKKFSDQIKMVMMDDYSVIYPLPKKFIKWYAKGTMLSIMPLGKANNIKSKGLKWELDHRSLELGDRTSSSNEAAEDGFVEIEYEGGFLLMMESNE